MSCFRRIAALLVLSGLLVSCSRSKEKESSAPRSRPPAPVVVTEARQADVPVEIDAVGNVEPFSLVSVRPQITGKIQEIHFREGQDVKAGDLLMTIDPTPWQAALNQVTANLERDQARLVQGRMEFLRTSNLFQSQIASEQDYQTAEAVYRAAMSTVQADAAAVTNALVNLSYTEIRSPVDGRTGLLQVKPGNVVKAPDDVLVTITQIRPAYVAFAVPEQHLSAIRRRSAEAELPVRAFAPGETNRAAAGKLTFIDNQVNRDTGTILLRATFENANLVLWPGQFVQAVLTLSNLPNATVVPTHAIQNGQNGTFVFVITNGSVAQARPVVTGASHLGITSILKGVAPGETVVTDGHIRVIPNGGVIIKAREGAPTGTNNAATVSR